MEHREKLYEAYFSTQAGRRADSDLRAQLAHDQRQLVVEVLPHLPEEKNAYILDVGCGYGSLLFLLKDKDYTETFGIDLSEDQIKQAKALGLENVACADAFAHLESLADDSLDVLVSIDVIEHLSKTEALRLLALAKQKLRAGGRVIFRTPNMDGVMGSVFAYGDMTHELLLNSSSAQQLMRTAGYTAVKVLPSALIVDGFAKRILQRLSWAWVRMWVRLQLLATARSAQGVLLTPNLIIVADIAAES